MATAARNLFLGLVVAATTMTTTLFPLLARETGLTCAEKYRAAKATGKLKHGVSEAVFMDKCASETRTEQARHTRKSRG